MPNIADPASFPKSIPVFPLPGALLLPRGQMPLNIFEPRYLAMVDDALRDGHRLIGMIQPDVTHSRDEAKPALFRVGCVGRITQLAESGDGRYILELTGIARFKVVEEMTVLTAYRQCKVDYLPVYRRFHRAQGRGGRRPRGAAGGADGFSESQQSQGRLGRHRERAQRGAGQRAGDDVALRAAEKQAMLEAPDLKTRAEILIAVTEMDLAKKRTSGDPGCSSTAQAECGPFRADLCRRPIFRTPRCPARRFKH